MQPSNKAPDSPPKTPPPGWLPQMLRGAAPEEVSLPHLQSPSSGFPPPEGSSKTLTPTAPPLLSLDFSAATHSLPSSFSSPPERGLCEDLARWCPASLTPHPAVLLLSGTPARLVTQRPDSTALHILLHLLSCCDGQSPRTGFPPPPSLGLCVVSCVTSKAVAMHHHCPETSPTPGQTVGSRGPGRSLLSHAIKEWLAEALSGLPEVYQTSPEAYTLRWTRL